MPLTQEKKNLENKKMLAIKCDQNCDFDTRGKIVPK